MRHFLRHFSLCLALIVGLRAQSQAPEEVVSVQFRILAWHGDVAALSYGRNQKVDATEMTSYSETQTYTGPATLIFNPYPRKKDYRTPAPAVASVLLPADAKKVTLLTIPDGHNRYGMYMIREDGGSLPARYVRLHNLTAGRLLIALNTNERIELAPAASALATAPGKALVVHVARLVNNRWRELFNNVVVLDDTEGRNVLFIPGAEGAGIGMFTQPGWPATTPATASATPSIP